MRLSTLVFYTFNILFWLLILRIFLTWIPNVNWEKQPFKGLAIFADMFLGPFRRIIPPVGGLDWSPILVLLLLQFCQTSITRALIVMGL